ncbi:MAG TPA: SCO family protein [Prosthecobacter sp.]|nr:SCO family protein [Prosthecobacter sp.]
MSDHPDSEQPPRPFNPWAVWIPIIIIVLSVVVLYNILMAQRKREMTELKDRPPYTGRLENDLTLTERSGKTVRLGELRGKIIIASWVFTRCPRGCAGVIAKLKSLHKEIGNDPGVQFVSFTLDPEDTPEMMQKFASGLQITEQDHWWFVNGPKDEVRKYMTSAFQFRPVQDLPEADRMSPDDKYIHDLRVALVDHKGHVRGLYDIMNADPEFQKFWDAKIRKDLSYLMREQKEGK